MTNLNDRLISVDNILWQKNNTSTFSKAQWKPICPTDFVGMTIGFNDVPKCRYVCPECKKSYEVPRENSIQQQLISDKIAAIDLKKQDILRLDDDNYVVVTKEKKTSEDNEYFVAANITDSKKGQTLVIYAGKRGVKEKSHIFVNPDEKRLSFDPKDIHPNEVFAKIEATFRDGSTHQIQSPGQTE